MHLSCVAADLDILTSYIKQTVTARADDFNNSSERLWLTWSLDEASQLLPVVAPSFDFDANRKRFRSLHEVFGCLVRHARPILLFTYFDQ
eukprot:SAG31_NODE_4642_length_3076_cov_76.513268_2_plen_90_part_00